MTKDQTTTTGTTPARTFTLAQVEDALGILEAHAGEAAGADQYGYDIDDFAYLSRIIIALGIDA